MSNQEKDGIQTKEIRVADSFWEEGPNGARLIASACKNCSRQYLPSVDVCIECGGTAFAAAPVDEPGTVYAFTVNHVPQSGYPEPYAVAFVDFPSGLRVFGQLSLEGNPPAIGGCVEVETATLYERSDARATGFRFRMIDSEGATR